MKTTINGMEVEGTPQEIVEMYNLTKDKKLKMTLVEDITQSLKEDVIQALTPVNIEIVKKPTHHMKDGKLISNRKCLNCNGPILLKGTKRERTNKKYCSHKCNDDALRKGIHVNPRRKIGQSTIVEYVKKVNKTIKKECKHCGRTLSKNKRSNALFCSTTCRVKNHNQQIREMKKKKYVAVTTKKQPDKRTIRMSFINKRSNYLMKQDYKMSREKAMIMASEEWDERNNPNNILHEDVKPDKFTMIAEQTFPDIYNISSLGNMMIRKMISDTITDNKALDLDYPTIINNIQGIESWDFNKYEIMVTDMMVKGRIIREYFNNRIKLLADMVGERKRMMIIPV